MKERKATITDVANKAGVSKATVSNYLNRRYDRMKEETKERILAAIESLDYVPSISARRLSAKEKSKIIGLIVPGNLANVFDTMYYPTVFSTVGKEAEKAGYAVLIYAQSKMADSDLEYLLGLGKSLVDGFLIFSLRQEDRYFKEFEKNNIPYVCVGRIAHYEDYRYVATDHRQAVRDAVEYLVSLGHSEIAMATDNTLSVVDQVRKEAFREILLEKGLTYREEHYHGFYTDEVAGEAEEVFDRMLRGENRPTGILLPANMMSYLKRAVKKNNIYIPRNLSVIALEYYDRYFPEYTTFQNMEYTRVKSVVDRVCSIAFRKLVDLIEKPEEEFESYLEPIKLEVGKTTGVCNT